MEPKRKAAPGDDQAPRIEPKEEKRADVKTEIKKEKGSGDDAPGDSRGSDEKPRRESRVRWDCAQSGRQVDRIQLSDLRALMLHFCHYRGSPNPPVENHLLVIRPWDKRFPELVLADERHPQVAAGGVMLQRPVPMSAAAMRRQTRRRSSEARRTRKLEPNITGQSLS